MGTRGVGRPPGGMDGTYNTRGGGWSGPQVSVQNQDANLGHPAGFEPELVIFTNDPNGAVVRLT